MEYLNVAISGEIGTGKSTLSKSLVQSLGWEYQNAGDFFRNWHQEHNIPLENTTEIPPELDKEVDMGFREQMASRTHVIFESRLAGWLAKDLPAVFKILVTCDSEVATNRAAGRDIINLSQAKKNNQIRSKGLIKKFRKLYGVSDYLDPKYFDLVVDTTNITPEKALKLVMLKLGS